MYPNFQNNRQKKKKIASEIFLIFFLTELKNKQILNSDEPFKDNTQQNSSISSNSITSNIKHRKIKNPKFSIHKKCGNIKIVSMLSVLTGSYMYMSRNINT